MRNHSKKCPHRKKGPRFLNCKCNLGVDGEIKGKRYRRPLFTRNLDKSYRKLAELERPDYREPKSIQDAIDAFKASKEDVGHGTKRNQRRVLSLAQDVWSGKFLANSKNLAVTIDSKEDLLVDGMGFEPTTPTLRTWCSPS